MDPEQIPLNDPTNYQAIANTSSNHQFSSSPNAPTAPIFLRNRRTLASILLVVSALLVVALTSTSIRDYTFHTRSFDYLDNFDGAFQPNLPGYANNREEVDGPDSFSVIEEVGTGDCSRGFLCRANLTLTVQNGVLTARAGYTINSKSGDPTNVNKWTRARIAKVTYEEAESWAAELIANAAPLLEEYSSSVDVEALAAVIFEQSKVAAVCPRTDAPSCKATTDIDVVSLISPSPSPSPSSSTVPSPSPSATGLDGLSVAIVHRVSQRRLCIIGVTKTLCNVIGDSPLNADQFWVIKEAPETPGAYYIENTNFVPYRIAFTRPGFTYREFRTLVVTSGPYAPYQLWRLEEQSTGGYVIRSNLYPTYKMKLSSTTGLITYNGPDDPDQVWNLVPKTVGTASHSL